MKWYWIAAVPMVSLGFRRAETLVLTKDIDGCRYRSLVPPETLYAASDAPPAIYRDRA